MVGDSLRSARLGQQRSLADVAGKAEVSVATLSRIETNKQSIDLGLFIRIASILHLSPADLLESTDGEGLTPLAQKIASLDSTNRTKLWRDLAEERRERQVSRSASRTVQAQVDELLAQIDFMRQEIEDVRMRVRKNR